MTKEKHWYFSKRKWMADLRNAPFHHMKWPSAADGERVLDDFFEEDEYKNKVGTTEVNGYNIVKEWCVYK